MKFSWHRFSLWGCVGWSVGHFIGTKNIESMVCVLIAIASSAALTILYLEAFGKLKK